VAKKNKVKELDDIVIKFVGDSGDGMQLTGTLFSDSSAIFGNDLATFPDYPAEIRAPHNTISGVSGFQVHIGKNKIYSYGDYCDILVAMNPASLKSNLKFANKGATIIIDQNTFDEKTLGKAGFKTNPLEDHTMEGFNLIKAPITNLTRASIEELGLNTKIAEKSKSIFALGIIFYILNRDLKYTLNYFEKRFRDKPEIAKANNAVLKAGYDFADTMETLQSTYQIAPAKLEKGKYRNITGNIATAWGLMAAAERSGRPLFLGSYPITPATDILVELSKNKSLGVKVLQAEDEIAGITSAIGASFAGSLAVTTTSGPGLSLKSEALGLAVMTELPLVVVDVQRGGPSTGLPTKSEQSDLMQALFGRNGEAPMIVIAASSPANCFDYAYMAAKLSIEHMTPVILLTDGFLGNGSQLFKIPKVASLPSIIPPIAQPNDSEFKPYRRDPNTLVRKWAVPGTEGLRHRIGGLEKENITGSVSTDPQNHQLMVKLRSEKVQKVADYIPEQTYTGCKEGDLLMVSWGSTVGTITSAIEKLVKDGSKVAHAHFHYIMPMPKNTATIFKKFKKILVCELNMGQFILYLRMHYPQFQYVQFNKIQGLPFTVAEIIEEIKRQI
jgi:2-oxoglutarate ferredoxin oxidoreductase subunit alpha